MRYLEFEARKLAYQPEGKGPAVVLLHGFCEDSSIWVDFKTDLLEDQYRVVCIDLPGFGSSELPQQNTIAYYAAAVNTVLESLDIKQAVLIGHSMGGYTALAFAERHPEKVLGIGLFHSHPYADTPEKKAQRLRQIQFIREQGHVLFVKQLMPGLFSESYSSHDSFLIKRLIHAATSFPAAGITAALEAMMNRPDYQEVLKNAAFPVLFIIGEEDNLMTEEQRWSPTTLPRIASIHLLKKTGHMGMFEARKRSQLIVREFVHYCSSLTQARG
jgi:pimeloyl-ACP methyl ester carboxylesterase